MLTICIFRECHVTARKIRKENCQEQLRCQIQPQILYKAKNVQKVGLKSLKVPVVPQTTHLFHCSYCVVFHVDKAMKSCLKDKDTKELTRGNTVCVQCNSKATRSHLGSRCIGHGAEGKRTRFKNVLTPRCHGKWTRLELIEGEECPCKGGPDFIFV